MLAVIRMVHIFGLCFDAPTPSVDELWYSSGEMFSVLTICSNEFAEKTIGLIASGFVKLRLI